MTTADDRAHFGSYRRQTQVKHTILSKYLPAYLHILKNWHGNIVYLDAFAGRGHYTNDAGTRFLGSPLLAIEMLAGAPDLAKSVLCLFVEKDEENFKFLRDAVIESTAKYPQVKAPQLFNESFADVVEAAKREIGEDLATLAPTFLFVDPCGIAGADFASVTSIAKRDRCEAFIFFNIDGLRRTAGLFQLSSSPSESLVEILGGLEPATELCQRLLREATPEDREACAIRFYIDRLREATSAEFFLPYRIEYEERRVTSHYLIHVSKHALGFKIMKDVMWDAAGDAALGGGLELLQASQKDGPGLFDTLTVDRVILDHLSKGPCRVSLFTEEWVCRPDDFVAPKHYRQRLLALEALGKVQVLAKDGKSASPATSRPKRNGNSTLAADYFVSLPKATDD